MGDSSNSFDRALVAAKKRGKFDKTGLEPLVAARTSLAPGTQKFFWDSSLGGFGVKVTPTKAMFVVEKRLPDGRNVRKTIAQYSELSIEDARDKAREVIRKIRDGVDPVEEKRVQTAQRAEEQRISEITITTVLQDYLRTYQKLRPKTRDVYERAVNRCFGAHPEGKWDSWLELSITEITDDMVAERQLVLSNANGLRGKGEAQANQSMRVLRTLFNFAIEKYKDGNNRPVVTRNPVKALKSRRLWNENATREDLIDDDVLPSWYQAVEKLDNTTVRDFLILLLFTGLRRSEAAKLRWDKVRLTGKRPILVIPKEDTKTGVEHRLPLPQILVEMLERRDKVRRIDNPYVFPGDKTGSHIIEPKTVISKAVEQSKVHFSCHTLRRTFGTIAARLDIAHYKHKKLMNHSTKADVTGAHYTKLTEEDLRDAMEKIADYIVSKAKIERVETAMHGLSD
jgi:integrase